MKLKRAFLILTVLFASTASTPAFSGVETLSYAEYRNLVKELAGKVNLFRDVWKRDSQAEFYGGTSRDFLYWVKGQFRDAKTPEDAKKIVKRLQSLPEIDIRDFIYGESDVDIVSSRHSLVDAKTYGVRKVDFQSRDIFDENTVAGFDDRNQGHIPT